MNLSAHQNLTNDQILERLKEKVITDHTQTLCERLYPCKRQFPYLISMSILTLSDCEEIEHCITNADKVLKLLHIIISKGQNGFDCLLESMRLDKTQMDLVTSMNIMLEKEWNRAFKVVNDEDDAYDSLSGIGLDPPPMV